MDKPQFERLTTVFGSLRSRRDALRLGSVTGALAALASFTHEADAKKNKKGAKKRCKKRKTRCGNPCVDTQNDRAHCGKCSNRCQGDLTCNAGQCRCHRTVCRIEVLIPDRGPYGVTVLADGNLATTLAFDDRLLILSPHGEILDEIGEFGTDPGEFAYPSGVAADGTGAIYVADQGNQRIQKRTSNGRIDVWGLDRTPYGVTATSSGTVYACLNDQVSRLTGEGQVAYRWGPGGQADSTFGSASNVASDRQGGLYVVDAEFGRIYRFTDNGPGAIVEDWVSGAPGADAGEFRGPWGIAAHDGRVYVADSSNRRVQVLDAQDGAFLFDWPIPASDGHPVFPNGVAVGADGRIYVATSWGIFRYHVETA